MCPNTAANGRIESVPAFVFWKNEKEISSFASADKLIFQRVFKFYGGNCTENVKSVTDNQDFVTQLDDAGDKLVVVEFGAERCGPCNAMLTHVQEQAIASPNVEFLRVDVDHNCHQTAIDYHIRVLPTYFFIRESKIVETFEGAGEENLKSRIAKRQTTSLAAVQREIGRENTVVHVTHDDGVIDENGVIDERLINDPRYKFVVIIFSDKLRCDQCKQMFLYVQDQAKADPDVLLLEVDREKCPKTATYYRIASVPEFVFRKNVNEGNRFVTADKLIFQLVFEFYCNYLYKNWVVPNSVNYQTELIL